MDPSQKGWLKEFLQYRKLLFLQTKEYNKQQGQHPDESFYKLVQPTGIMYGYPVHFYELDKNRRWKYKDVVKVLLADSYINIATLYYSGPVETAENFVALMYRTMDSVNNFYNGIYPEISTSSTNWLGKKKDILSITERLLEKRIDMIFKSSGNFWTEFFYHTQLFLDIYIFGQWTHTQPDQVLLDFFKGEKADLSYTAVKVMAAAAHCNEHIEVEEKKLFQHFIENVGLPSEKKRVAYEYFEHGLRIQEIPLGESDPWVIRKFFLELAILMVWSDKKVERIEWDFLNTLNSSLGFSDIDFNHSMIAVEGFVLQNWPHLDALREKKDHQEISIDYTNRIVKIAQQYNPRIKSEIVSNKQLHYLIRKGTTQALSATEKSLVRSFFIGILKDIPAFRTIALPTAFLTYEMMLKIIPDEVIQEVIS